jgi:hypothetical protein
MWRACCCVSFVCFVGQLHQYESLLRHVSSSVRMRACERACVCMYVCFCGQERIYIIVNFFFACAVFSFLLEKMFFCHKLFSTTRSPAPLLLARWLGLPTVLAPVLVFDRLYFRVSRVPPPCRCGCVRFAVVALSSPSRVRTRTHTAMCSPYVTPHCAVKTRFEMSCNN